MEVRLDKADLIALVCGLNPPMKLYRTHTQFCENQWKWNCEKLNSMNEEELYELYLTVRDSKFIQENKTPDYTMGSDMEYLQVPTYIWKQIIQELDDYEDGEITVFHSEWTHNDFTGDFDSCSWRLINSYCPIHKRNKI